MAMRTSGNLWIYVTTNESASASTMPFLNCAHIAFISETKGGTTVTMTTGDTMPVQESFEEITSRLANPFDEGRLEVAFAADIEG